MRLFMTGAAIIAIVGSSAGAYAAKAPSLPPGAKKLSGKEIVALYDGSAVDFDNYTMVMSLAGTGRYDFKHKSIAGNFVMGDKKGKFTGSIRIKGDRFCYKVNAPKETCVSIYVDGDDIYEVNAKGIVTSKNKKH